MFCYMKLTRGLILFLTVLTLSACSSTERSNGLWVGCEADHYLELYMHDGELLHFSNKEGLQRVENASYHTDSDSMFIQFPFLHLKGRFVNYDLIEFTLPDKRTFQLKRIQHQIIDWGNRKKMEKASFKRFEQSTCSKRTTNGITFSF